MIFYINFPEDQLALLTQQNVNNLLGGIAVMITRGEHFVVMDRNNIAYIKANIQLTEQNRITIDYINSKYTQDAQIISQIRPYVKICRINDHNKVVDDVYEIGLSVYFKRKYYEKPKFLVENKLNDGDFLKYLLYISKKENKIENLSFEVAHGGGSDLPANYKRFLEEHIPVVSIFDSDKKFPEDKQYDKIKTLNRECKGKFQTPNIFFELPCHELENLVPLAIKRDLPLTVAMSPDDKSNLNKCMTLLKLIEDAESADEVPAQDRFVNFFDFKNGVSFASVNAMADNGLKSYLTKMLKIAGQNRVGGEIPPINSGLTKLVVADDRAKSNLYCEIKKCQYWKYIYSDLFKRAAAIFYSFQPRPSF